ncbi:MAG: MBL fold metallo-hydrolase [Chloroflexota bacterium]|nr:MBL fold metallo-hydrolase [Chloroflexota bacterium]
MMLERFFTPGLAQVAYGIADVDTGVAAVIDPRRDVAVYTDWAAAHGLRIVAILETHIHADFVSGAGELAATGATVYASWFGDQTFPHQSLADGEEVAVGNLCLRALWTPGHTPEHLAYLLIDPARGPNPAALFSGDALFVGEVGRPDLLGEEQTRTLAKHLYRTVTGRLSRLDDALVVYPGHTAGSACGKQIGDAPTTTIGQEKRFSYAFQARSPDAFVRMVLDGMPKPPSYYPILKRVNRDGAAPLATLQPDNR